MTTLEHREARIKQLENSFGRLRSDFEVHYTREKKLEAENEKLKILIEQVRGKLGVFGMCKGENDTKNLICDVLDIFYDFMGGE